MAWQESGSLRLVYSGGTHLVCYSKCWSDLSAENELMM